MIRINFQSDFTLRVTLRDSAGEPLAVPANPWSVHITDTAGTCWKCAYNGAGGYEDCAVDDGVIVCYVNNPGFVPGVLAVTFHNDIPNNAFADRVENQVTPATASIMLWDGPTEGGDAVDVSMLLSVIAPRVIDADVDIAGDLQLTFNT